MFIFYNKRSHFIIKNKYKKIHWDFSLFQKIQNRNKIQNQITSLYATYSAISDWYLYT